MATVQEMDESGDNKDISSMFHSTNPHNFILILSIFFLRLFI